MIIFRRFELRMEFIWEEEPARMFETHHNISFFINTLPTSNFTSKAVITPVFNISSDCTSFPLRIFPIILIEYTEIFSGPYSKN